LAEVAPSGGETAFVSGDQTVVFRIDLAFHGAPGRVGIIPRKRVLDAVAKTPGGDKLGLKPDSAEVTWPEYRAATVLD
jgi:hypothetical protein